MRKSAAKVRDAGSTAFERIVREARALSRPHRVTNAARFRLKDVDPASTDSWGEADKERGEAALRAGVEALARLQEILYAQDRWGLLLMFQAMDGAGKDSVIEHVLSGVNPQGCQVAAFKAPSVEELDHDYLWRCQKHLPERGRIGIFNRSWYEEVLVVRVHPEILASQRLPAQLIGKQIWKERYEDIRAFERYLGRNGIVIRKFFLHVSREEQARRFLDRIEDPEKNWKFAMGDLRERARWADYMAAYEDMVRSTSTPDAPWYVVPADYKWRARLVVAGAVIDALASLELEYPRLPAAQKSQLAAARRALLAELK